MGLTAIETLIRNVGPGLEGGDCLISPAIEHLSPIRFAHRPRLIALGRQAAEEKLSTIRQDLGL